MRFVRTYRANHPLKRTFRMQSRLHHMINVTDDAHVAAEMAARGVAGCGRLAEELGAVHGGGHLGREQAEPALGDGVAPGGRDLTDQAQPGDPAVWVDVQADLTDWR